MTRYVAEREREEGSMGGRVREVNVVDEEGDVGRITK